MHRNILRRYLKHGLFPQLAVFEACARLGSFTKAADELSLAQPTVSCQIRKLSETLGVPLFDTSGKQAILTPAGHELSFVCAEIFSSLIQLDERMSTLRDSRCTALRVATTACTQYMMGAALEQLDCDEVDISLDIMNRRQLLDALPERRHDLYLVEDPPATEGLRAVPVRRLALMLVAHRDHPAAKVVNLELRDLAKQNWVAREEGAGPRAALVERFASEGIDLRIRRTLGSNEAVRQAVAHKLGIALLPADMFAAGPEAEGLIQLTCRGFPLWQACSALVPDTAHAPAALEELIAALR